MSINIGLGTRRRFGRQSTNIPSSAGTGRQSTPETTGSQSTLETTGSQSPPDDDWEALDFSSTEYARRRREMMQLINDLKSMGAETMIDLPSIVVIGCQSAGKSSLVEAVSGINVPRDSGTCTRCPMECTMSSNATAWSCTIKLRFDYDSAGRSAGDKQKVLPFGPTITNKDDVDVWLRRAQAAILNPDLPPETFHRRTLQELRNSASTNALKFSRNVVCVFIDDPDAIDLSFVDLPGLIQNDDQETVDLVNELTVSYIRRSNTIILATIPMSDDMKNQLSVKLAREADPEGERTIGILTKPDLVGDGAINSKMEWANVIEGRQDKLKHGYYCVRLPDDTQRAQRLPRAVLQRRAENYLNTTAPWSEVADRKRFGIPAFVSDVSVLLVNHIRKVIPQLKADVERLLADCIEEIGTLPKPLETDPQVEVLLRINAFCDAFKGMVSGASSEKSLVQRNGALYEIFARNIRGTAPDFRPFETPMKYVPFTDFESEESTSIRDDRVQTMGVYDVRKTIKESTAWELPGNIPYEAKTRLINQFTILWPRPAEKCLESINDVLDDVFQKLAKTHFGRFKVLEKTISDLIRPDIEEHKIKALVAIKETLGLEIAPIYTQNLKDYQGLRVKWYAKYRKARRLSGQYQIFELPPSPDSNSIDPLASPSMFVKMKSHSGTTSPEEEALRYLAQAGYKGLTVDDLARLYPPDGFEDELNVMADVRAYFTIACKRTIDHVPLKIEQTLHQALADCLSASLLKRLLLDTTLTGSLADRMRELVKEDPGVQARRVQLESKRTRLQEMKMRLVSFAA